MVNENSMKNEIKNRNINIPTTYNNIPAKMLMDNVDRYICTPYITKIYNDSVLSSIFLKNLKRVDITTTHKMVENILKNNYRPVSILPCVSKLFERNTYDQIWLSMERHLSAHLCGFRKGYSTEYCLIAMLEKCKKALQK